MTLEHETSFPYHGYKVPAMRGYTVHQSWDYELWLLQRVGKVSSFDCSFGGTNFL